MKKKDFIRIINEEIGEFDFLNNDKYLAEQENIQLLQEEYFQKQFIIDSITRKKEKIRLSNENVEISYIDPELDDPSPNDLYVDYFADIDYNFDDSKEPIKFSIGFGGKENVKYGTEGYYDPGSYGRYDPPEGEQYISHIEWSAIPVSLYTREGDEIELKALEKEPLNIQELFIRSYLESAIEDKTGYDIQEKKPAYNSPPKY